MSFRRGARKLGGFPRNGEMAPDIPSRHSREGWVMISDHDSVYIGGKQYRHMREWRRPCAVCGAPFPIYEKIGTTEANSRFSNRTCDAHRGLLPAFEKGYIAWDGHVVVAGIKCGKLDNSAPVQQQNGFAKINVEGGKYTVEDNKELEAAYDVNVKLMSDLSAANARYEAVFRELQECKAKLARYELPAAMQQLSNKMPWHG